jgi:oxaloacetate decarboxylase gamma subunit
MDNLQPLIIQSLELLLIGMGTVFIILVMLIFLINTVSKILRYYGFEDSPVEPRTTPSSTSSSATSSDQTPLIAVISAAVNAYRKRHS